MAHRDELERVLAFVLASYRDTRTPEFHFVSAARSEGRFDDVVAVLLRAWQVTDVSDDNIDVGRYLRLEHGTRVLYLRLSFVGPFACLLRARGARLELVESCCAVEEEEEVMRQCAAAGLQFLSREVLEAPVNFTLHATDPGNVRVFQVLFSDSDLLPWAQ